MNRINTLPGCYSIITQLLLAAMHHLSLLSLSRQRHQRAQGFHIPGTGYTRVLLGLPEILVLASPTFVLKLL